MNLTLYHHKGACSLAPLIALEESGLGYTLEIINLATDRPAYVKVNPSGKVPALTLDGELLTENLAILYRIASLAPAAGLLPSDPESISRTLSLMAWFGSTVHILRRQVRMPLRFTSDADAQAKLVEAGRPKMWDALREMETRLGDKDWFGGHVFGVADSYALVFYGWGLNDGFPMNELVQLTSWKDRMLARPAVIHALGNDAGVLHDRLEGAA